MEKQRVYICIDLKSFYASVECVERGLDPLSTNLVVADSERSEKTICLAITPPMKALGLSSRCRVFEIPKGVDYIMATPRMQLYIEYSANIYEIYLKYIAKEDIHVYSIDEVFMDVTDYLTMYGMSAKELAVRIMRDVYESTGITATAGIGTNLYLAKVALDITAKHVDDHIGYLDEETYQKTLWDHIPLTDFWRVGAGTVKRLEKYGIYNMGQIAHSDEDFLYKLFGIDAELLIDHAWGREITTIGDIKNYKPKHNSLSSGQVLSRDYGYDEGMLIVKEMADLLCLDLVDKGLITQSISLYVGYSNALKIEGDRGSISMTMPTSSAKTILPYIEQLYKKVVKPYTPVRRFNLSFNNVVDETYQQYDIFADPVELEKEHNLQKAMIDIKKKFGKNAILKGMNLEEGGTTMERNKQIGGHRSGE
ncbi:MAG: DNA repair protein [Lachnospiraceae bacterium]|nr:DNA repair protein [Lachnospiraceae bacterium]